MSFYVPLNKHEPEDLDDQLLAADQNDAESTSSLTFKDNHGTSLTSPYLLAFWIVIALFVVVNLACLAMMSRETAMVRSMLRTRLDLRDTRELPSRN